MSGVTGAVIGAGVAAAGATVYASNQAADATQSATDASIAQQNKALGAQATLSAPYRKVGQDAIPGYEDLLGIGKGGSGAELQALQNTPGYQFTQQQGETGILNAASAAGGVSGNTLADLDKYNAGLASGTYQQAVDNSARAVGTGQAAAAGQAQNVGNAASTISSALTAQGATTAGIDASTVAGLSKTIGNTGNQLVEAQTLAALNQNPGAGGGVYNV